MLLKTGADHLGDDGGVRALSVASAEDQRDLPLAGMIDQLVEEGFAPRLRKFLAVLVPELFPFLWFVAVPFP